MKVLNLDALAKTNRKLTVGGKTYDVQEMTVENFIETTKEAEKLGDHPTMAQQIEASVDVICRYVPELDQAVLKKLPLDQLITIVQFVRGDMDVEETESVEGESDAGKQ